ncbi:MAG: hypothetical protein AB8B63_22810 [Granulosicoccus sp.]
MVGVEKVLVTVSIDTECDHDSQWVRSNPLTFRSIHEGLPDRLQPLFTEAGAIPTYLLTVEVLEDRACVHTLGSMQGKHEFGTHLHAALIEPEKKFQDYAGVDSPDFQCGYAEHIEYQKMHNLTELFRAGFGYAPTSFRAGRYGASAQSVDILQRLGYRVDTSVTPGMKWSEPNATVDFRQAPEQPYFPARGAISRPAAHWPDGRILEVPVTVKPRFFRNPRWFRPWFSSVDQMKDIARYHLHKFRHQPVIVINMMFHSMEVIEKASPYPQTSDDVHRFLEDMHSVLRWCAEEGMQFTALSDLYQLYESAGQITAVSSTSG